MGAGAWLLACVLLSESLPEGANIGYPSSIAAATQPKPQRYTRQGPITKGNRNTAPTKTRNNDAMPQTLNKHNLRAWAIPIQILPRFEAA